MLKKLLEEKVEEATGLNYFSDEFKSALQEIIDTLAIDVKKAGIVDFEENGKKLIGIVDFRDKTITGYEFKDGVLGTTPVISKGIVSLTKIMR